jgi:type III secretory pathway component EscR
MPSKHWKLGNSAYKDFLDSLTEEERAAHFAEKKLKASIKKANNAMISYQMEKWLSAYNTAMMAQRDKAFEGDTQAFIALRDALGLKPETQLTVDTEFPLPWNDDFDEDLGDD